jgi:hypothetical protein
MSMLDNLRYIAAHGPEAFLVQEKDRWECPGCGGLICVHKPNCLYYGRARDESAPLVGDRSRLDLPLLTCLAGQEVYRSEESDE